ncbi:putative transcriptional regulator [Sedimentisphaera cyanobacteriorum]|uniref:Putative transcriptional regulator n=1 Tax=Sedimentisphaera cyanobacteriorum TaxID=1940790 RepID=A0A1Q2HQ95_9BACT|nr:AlpA family phage regulatory protein [Sedimentisphaera cyanobacteriorum]AQQ09639.1 putative transcriptional regulator [Sedimentisphaera cyanobacteriorum]
MKTQEIGQKLLTAKAVSEMLSLSKRQIFRLNCCGKMPAPIRIGGSVRWANSTIQSWIDMGCPDRQTFEAMQQTGGEK